MRNRRCDPEPFAIVTGIAGIVGGLAGTVSLFKTFVPVSLRHSHRRIITILDQTVTNLAGIGEAIERMERAISTGLDLGQPPFLLGSRVVLVPLHFREYSKSADDVMRLLRAVLKATHKLERRISVLPYMAQEDLLEVVDLQLKIEDVLHGRNRGAADTLRQLRPIVAKVRELVEDLRRDLHNQVM